MRVFTCDDHRGHWGVGTASVVVANDEDEARKLLTAALEADGLGGDVFTLKELDMSTPHALVLRNGEY